jgi:hypothetical protein
MLIYHCPLRYTGVLTRKQIITFSVFKLGVLPLTKDKETEEVKMMESAAVICVREVQHIYEYNQASVSCHTIHTKSKYQNPCCVPSKKKLLSVKISHHENMCRGGLHGNRPHYPSDRMLCGPQSQSGHSSDKINLLPYQ